MFRVLVWLLRIAGWLFAALLLYDAGRNPDVALGAFALACVVLVVAGPRQLTFILGWVLFALSFFLTVFAWVMWPFVLLLFLPTIYHRLFGRRWASNPPASSGA